MRMNKKISVDQEITGLPGVKIGDFWSWAYSDVLSNTIRPLFAEFLVGYALDVIESPRIEWNYYKYLFLNVSDIITSNTR
jgi:glutathione peroxidase-family protein